MHRAGGFRVWRGCKPKGLKRRLGGGLGEAEGPTGKATVQIARHARLQPRQVCGRAQAHMYANICTRGEVEPFVRAEPLPRAGKTRSSYSQTQTLVQGKSNPRTGQNAYPSRAEL